MDFVIDHRIRDWVFIPVLYVMFMMGLLKIFLSKMMQNKKKETSKIQKTVDDNRNKSILMRAQKIGAANTLLTPRGFFMRKTNLIKRDSGLLWERENDTAEDPMQAMQKSNPMMNPGNMADMLKNNLFMTIMTPLQFGFISYFFTGYIVGKVPFPQTQKFREMLQKGIECNGMDVKYVSALSLYFLTIFGFGPLHKMLLTHDPEDNDAMNPMNDPSMNPMAMNPMGQQASPFSQPPTLKDNYKKERDNVEVIQYEFKIEKAEQKLIDKWNLIQKSK